MIYFLHRLYVRWMDRRDAGLKVEAHRLGTKPHLGTLGQIDDAKASAGLRSFQARDQRRWREAKVRVARARKQKSSVRRIEDARRASR